MRSRTPGTGVVLPFAFSQLFWLVFLIISWRCIPRGACAGGCCSIHTPWSSFWGWGQAATHEQGCPHHPLVLGSLLRGKPRVRKSHLWLLCAPRSATDALRAFAPPQLGLGVTHTSCRDGVLLSLRVFWFFPFLSGQGGGREGKDCRLFLAEDAERRGGGGDGSDSSVWRLPRGKVMVGSPPSSSGEQWSCRSCSLCSRLLSEM